MFKMPNFFKKDFLVFWIIVFLVIVQILINYSGFSLAKFFVFLVIFLSFLAVNLGKFGRETSQTSTTDESDSDIETTKAPKEVIKGEFIHLGDYIKQEAGKIYIKEEEEERSYVLKEDGVVILCTAQVIGDKSEVNYDQIYNIKPLSPPYKFEDHLRVDQRLLVLTVGKSEAERAQSIVSDRCVEGSL